MRGYVGLGSNMGDRQAHLNAGLEGLDAGGAAVLRVSSLYETAPYGEYPEPQPDFLNAVAEIETDLAPVALLALCKQVEAGEGRDLGGPRHGPRPLDLDVLLLGSERVAVQGLEIPHPGIAERRFVLEPLLELDPGARLPDGSPPP
jgi:2-amino-4-hydroxy-6-hydroxymethyldihydropteridine diphosphokinase